jgi:hypothetical protein
MVSPFFAAEHDLQMKNDNMDWRVAKKWQTV